MSQEFKIGDKVRLTDPHFRTDEGKLCPLSDDWNGVEGTVAGNPDREGDIPIRLSEFRCERVSPHCLVRITDPVSNPSHYKAPGLDVECMDVIQALGLDFPTGSALKYIWRHRNKGRPLQDLKKARANLDRAIQAIENADPPSKSDATDT